jgi:hypothetical protein
MKEYDCKDCYSKIKDYTPNDEEICWRAKHNIEAPIGTVLKDCAGKFYTKT